MISRQPKESQYKTSKLSVLTEDSYDLCPVSTLFTFITKTMAMREKLSDDHTLFLAYIHDLGKVCSISPSTLANWVKKRMQEAGVDIQKYKAHSLRSASSTYAVQQGHSISKVKQHAHWSEKSNTFEKYYYKPFNSYSEGSDICKSMFSSMENNTTISGFGTKATEIVLSMPNNPKVAEEENKDIVVIAL